VRVVTADLISRARAGDGEAFRELTEPYRRELQEQTITFSTLLPRHAETSAACRGNMGPERDHFVRSLILD
jgi:hypothetical protein